MLKYRVLDVKANKFLEEDKVVLLPSGVVIYDGAIQLKPLQVQTSMGFIDKNDKEVYIGDAVKTRVESGSILYNTIAKNVTELPTTMDEVVIQFTTDSIYGYMYYWLLFKNKGEFIKNKDANWSGTNEDNKDDLRAVPTNDLSLIRMLTNHKYVIEIVHTCTDPEWVNPMTF